MSYSYSDGKHPAEYFSEEILKNPILSEEEESKIFKKTKSRNEKIRTKAKNKIIKSNLKLVIKIAGKYKNLGIPLEDLINEGSLGLMRAIEKYDPKKNTKFSFYAALWIRQSVTRALSNKSKTIRIPHGLINEAIRLKKSKGMLEEKLGRTPTNEELSKESRLSVKKIRKINLNIPTTVSFNTPTSLSGGEECDLEVVLPDTKISGVVETITKEEDHHILKQLLSQLSEREIYIIIHRYGLDENKKQTLETIGKKFNLTRERIRQIEKESINKLRKGLTKIEGKR